MKAQERRDTIAANVRPEKQVTKQDSELLDEILPLVSELSPLAKQRLAMQLLAEVAQSL